MDRCDLTSLTDHSLSICCSSFYLAADRSVNDGCDLFDHFVEVSSFFGDQGRICGNTTDNSHVICFSDIFYFRCVDKKFHCFFLLFTFVLFLDDSIITNSLRGSRHLFFINKYFINKILFY